jgi:DNA-binding XRE family transcriptional regulator
MLDAMRQTAIALRKQDPKRYTQEKLAESLGVSRQVISKWTNAGEGSIATRGNASLAPDARMTIPKDHILLIVARSKKGESQAQIAADYKVTKACQSAKPNCWPSQLTASSNRACEGRI